MSQLSKRYASLTGGLLARKGEASPAAAIYVTNPYLAPALGHDHYPQTEAAAITRADLRSAPRLDPAALRVETHVAPPRAPDYGGDEFLGEDEAAPLAVLRAPEPQEPVPPPPVIVLPPAAEPPPVAGCGTGACGADVDPGKTFHVSVRLKKSRYLKLKLAAATFRRPSQEIVGEALDAWFAAQGALLASDCPCLKDGN